MKNKFLKELSSIIDYSKYNFLLAVSGGVDSMVLAYLFHRLNIKFSIAHCNFCLRDSDSDDDEKLVKEFAKKNKVNFFSKKFKTDLFAKENKISIQMAARNLRYDWFKHLMKKEKIDFLVTAHHYDDIVETVFINLSRGTGISGLTGIKKMENNIIRPLLIFDKDDIIDFSKKNKINYREDSSNIDEKYVRNKIRHSIIPEFEKINSNFKKSFSSTLDYLNSVKHIYENFIQKEIQNYVDYKDGVTRINLGKLKKSIEPKSVLHEIIKHYNFSDIDGIFDSIDSDSGREFFSNTHYLVKDREYYLITQKINPISIKIYESTDVIKDPIFLTFNLIDPSGQNKSKKNALLDYSKLSFPLTLRSYKKGDWFIPSGMTGKKKLSDYFIDNKFSMIDKKKCLVLCSQEDIVWVVGRRVDERYKLVGTQEKAYICRTK
tara:strand:+ start:56 stop:1354 length:1299 start_codon:yes stop_codon:yes gene_type:complete